MWNGFYKLDNLDTAQLKNLFSDAMNMSPCIKIDKLDLSKSMSRETDYDKSILDIIPNVSKNNHNVFINRYESVKTDYNKHGEIGYNKDNMYVFIYVSLDNLEKLAKKYNLKKNML